MKTLIVHNPTKTDIIDYDVSEAEIDPRTEDAVMNTSTGLPTTTGKTLQWSIKGGQTLEFPAYVGRYLLQVYSFLDKVGEDFSKEVLEEPKVVGEEEKEETPVASKPMATVSNGMYVCSVCGKECKTSSTLGMHMGAKHPEAFGL